MNSTEKLLKGTKRQVFNGTAFRTSGGLTKADLVRVRKGTRSVLVNGKRKNIDVFSIVSKKKSKLGKENSWMKAVKEARKELNIEGFYAVKKGTPLYTLAKKIHTKKQTEKRE